MNRIAVFFLLFLAIGCGSSNDVPGGILPPEKMQYVMWDMIRADALISNGFDSILKKPGKRMELYSTVLKTHKLSKEEFEKSMQYYEAHPNLLKVVIDSMQQIALRDTTKKAIKDTSKILRDTTAAAKDSLKPAKDTAKAVLPDAIKRKLDSLKTRKFLLQKRRLLKNKRKLVK